MKVIGIIAAMEEEFEEIANIMSEVKEKRDKQTNIYYRKNKYKISCIS